MPRTAHHHPNWGGARPGAGRKPKPPVLFEIAAQDDPMQFLLAAMNRPDLELSLRVDAAKALMPYMHARFDPAGKKATRHESAAVKRYPAAVPPRLAGTDRSK